MYIVEIKENIPIVVYDDQCYLCTKFAKMVNFLSRGNLTIIGHYSNEGEEIRNQILDDSALEMFWVIDEKTAFGGRAALIPLIRAIITSKKKKSNNMKLESNCKQECKTVKSVFIRSASLLSNSKKIELK
jgi:predicted DCC family thiol-disulfide oxidoreductase YuxK